MRKRIYCTECWCNSEEKANLTKEDRALGYRDRTKFLAGVHPENHLVLDGPLGRIEASPQVQLQCDLCGVGIDNGGFAVAVSVWHTRDTFPDNINPGDWESKFGTVIEEQAFKVGLVLEGKRP